MNMWRPLPLDKILSGYHPFDRRVLGSILIWLFAIFGCIALSLYYLPSDWISQTGDRSRLLRFFILNPPMLLSLLLLLWLGFEWSFIPVFLSFFIIGIFSHLPFYWAILFALSFVFSLGIYALVYQCLDIRYDLRSLSSIAVFIFTSFVASTASSLGAFIWSFSHELSAFDTANLWNGWWTGSLLQAVFIAGPVLFLFSPFVEAVKEKYFEIPEKEKVSVQWVYSAVLITTLVIAVFIYASDHLAKNRMAEEIAGLEVISQHAIMNSLDSFEIITWVSIWIIFCVGLGGIFLIGSWNKELQNKVNERTAALKEAEDELKDSLDEKVVLLKEIHHRVKNNLAVVTALLDLQYMRADSDEIKDILTDAKSRVKSMAFVHETLYQTENFSRIDLERYLGRVCNSVETALKPSGSEIELNLETDGTELEMGKAIPLGLILNEVIVNAYKHAFPEMNKGNIRIRLFRENGSLYLNVQDNGVGLHKDVTLKSSKSLGVTLIKTLSRQLNAEVELKSETGITEFKLKMQY